MTKAELLVENQRLHTEIRDYKYALNSKSQLLIRVLNDLDKESKENHKLRTEDGEYAGKCGKLEVELQVLKYRFELAKIAYHKKTGEYNPKWPIMTRNDLYWASRDKLPTISEKTDKNEIPNNLSDDILDLFKQSSKGI